jgi:hypothetical protein
MTTLDAPQAGGGVRDGLDDTERTRLHARPGVRRVLLTGLFVGLVALMLRAGPGSMTRTFPDLGDPVFIAWSLSWSAHAAVTQPLHLFDANIFWAHPLSLAYADSLLVVLPPFALVRALGGSAALGINALMFGLLVLSLASAYSLTRWLTGHTGAALVGAVAFTFSSYTLSHLSHPQLLLLGLFPLGFWLAFRWLERRGTADAVLLGVVNVAFFLGALYYAVVWAMCLAIVLCGWVLIARLRVGAGFWRGIAVAGAVSLLAVPFVVPYARLDQDRFLVPEWGLNPADVVTVAPGSILYSGLDDWSAQRGDRIEHSYFPGFVTLTLAVIGSSGLALAALRRRRRTNDAIASTPAVTVDGGVLEARRQYLWLLLIAGAASVVLALGPEVRGIPMPFRALHDHVPGFSGIRVAARLAVPGLLAGVVLAASGFAIVTRRLGPRATAAVAAVVVSLLVLELAAPLSRVELPTGRATLAVYRALAHRPAGAVAELPIKDPLVDGGAAWAYVEAPRMVYATEDWHPRVNGYSGGWPDGHLEDIRALNEFPSRRSLDAATRLRVRYVVLHTGSAAGYAQYSDGEVRALLRELPPGARAERFGRSWLVDLRAGAA